MVNHVAAAGIQTSTQIIITATEDANYIIASSSRTSGYGDRLDTVSLNGVDLTPTCTFSGYTALVVYVYCQKVKKNDVVRFYNKTYPSYGALDACMATFK